MNAYFFDSSDLVKRYIVETGSKWIIGLLKPSTNNLIFIAPMTGVEVVSAIARRRKGLTLTQTDAQKAIFRFQRDFRRRFVKTNLTSQLVEAAMQIANKHELRGYDAVQLGSALEANRLRQNKGLSAITFISADNNLNSAAIAEGLAGDNPNNH
ncbi:MAG: type II toxin-antitoxin system VapC family toxin [Acidobacteriota bacterium]|nr:type II toxin-antitoxin system VapC family toxin [Acidobacteriota bacterium]